MQSQAGSLMIFLISSPAILPASFVARFCASEKYEVETVIHSLWNLLSE